MGTAILAIAAVSCAFVAVVLTHATPRGSLVAWLVVLFFAPIWVGVSIGPFWSGITLATILMICASARRMPLTAADGVMAAFVVLVAGQFALGLTSFPALFIALTEWVVPYVWGRLVLSRVSENFLVGAVTIVASIAAILAVVEGVTGVNPFVSITFGSGDLYDAWGQLQARSASIRVEGAFGHSIALGASLAMSSAFVLASRLRTSVKLLLLLVIGAAVALTLSRIGLITLVLTVALSLVLLPSVPRRTKVLVVLAGVVAALAVVPVLQSVFDDAGQEAGGSADYRTDLWRLAEVIPLFGSAPSISGLTVDGQFLGVFARSIDNALLVAAMRVGWVPALLLVAVLVLAVLPLLRRGSRTPAGTAVAAQLPGLLAVALITQYSMFFWFSAGLAVAMAQSRAAASRTPFDAPDDRLAWGVETAPRGPLVGWGVTGKRGGGLT